MMASLSPEKYQTLAAMSDEQQKNLIRPAINDALGRGVTNAEIDAMFERVIAREAARQTMH